MTYTSFYSNKAENVKTDIFTYTRSNVQEIERPTAFGLHEKVASFTAIRCSVTKVAQIEHM